jgi:PPM family protein phosphatase
MPSPTSQHGSTAIVDYAGGTTLGARRDVNDDAFGVFEGNNVFAVVDGCGGYSPADSAARLTIESFRRVSQGQVTGIDGLNGADPLAVAVLHANVEVLRAADANPLLKGQAATVCAARAFKRWIAIAHVGDCRVGRYRDGGFTWLTEDHCLVAELRKSGAPAEEIEEKAKIFSTILMRAVGVQEPLSIDVSYHPTAPGDVYLLCSDGLSRHVESSRISELLGVHSRRLQTCCAALLEASEQAGGHDNATVILLGMRA